MKVLAVVIISQGGTSPFLKLWQITEWFEYKFKKKNMESFARPRLSRMLEESILVCISTSSAPPEGLVTRPSQTLTMNGIALTPV